MSFIQILFFANLISNVWGKQSYLDCQGNLVGGSSAGDIYFKDRTTIMSSAVIDDNNILTVPVSSVVSGGTVRITLPLNNEGAALQVDGGSLTSTGVVGEAITGCTGTNTGLVWGGAGRRETGESTITWTAPSDTGDYSIYIGTAAGYGSVKRGVYQITVAASPTTASPTTASPTTASPTTASPTTGSPTNPTPSPTTLHPTNPSPTDAPATTASPTDAPATTGSPTTPSPTNPTPSPTNLHPTNPSTDAPATDAPATTASPTDAPATTASPTDTPATDASATDTMVLPPTNAPTFASSSGRMDIIMIVMFVFVIGLLKL